MGYESKQPVLKLKTTRLEYALQIISLGLIIGTVLLIILSWNSIPAKIPAHFGASGEVNRWGGRGTLFIVPIVMILFYMFLTFTSKFPHYFNYLSNITEKNAEMQYRNSRLMIFSLMVETIAYFAFLEYKIINVALNNTGGLGAFPVLLFLLILFGTLIYFLVSTIRIDKRL